MRRIENGILLLRVYHIIYHIIYYNFKIFCDEININLPTSDINAMRQECNALEEVSRQLFLESVDLHNEQVR